MTDIIWSEWLDYNSDQISKIPEESGVYMMHAAMKILYIGNATNLKQTILESLNHPCTKEATRFKYSLTSNHKQIGDQILKEYQEKHNNNLPKCME